MKIRQVLDAGAVVRYHATLIEVKQDNSQHQWEVSVILAHIFPEAKADLLLYALTHDAGEIATGDTPAQVKRAHPTIKEKFDEMEHNHRQDELGLEPPNFSDREMLALKYADILSGIYYTSKRVRCGDQHAQTIRDKWLEYAGSLPYLNDVAQQAIEDLK